jgi:ribosomal-protein-alanine N-acetyltransferase
MLRPTLSPAGVSVSKPTMIGVIGTPREADIGYKLSKAHWGKGYMTEAIALFLDLFWSLPG